LSKYAVSPTGHRCPDAGAETANVLQTMISDEKRAGRALLWKGLQMGATKLLNLVGTLILGHLLAPQEFGLVAIAAVAITTIMAATETGMTSALVQASVREQVHYDVAWTIGSIRGLIVCAALLFAAPLVARLFGEERAAPLVRLMALLPLISSVASPRMADLIRELQFSKLAPIAIVAVMVEVGLAISLATRIGGEAMILGKLAGAATITLSSYLIAPHRPRFRPSYAPARQLIAFGRWLFAISLTAVASDLFIKVLIARRLSVNDLGVFSMSDKLAELPTQFANESIGAVAFPLYAKLRSDAARLQIAVRAHLTGLMFFLLPATALIIALAQPLEVQVLGPAWAGMASLVVLLALGYVFELAFNAIYFLLQALGAGARLFLVELTQYITLIVAVIFLSGRFGLTGIGIARIVTSIVLAITAVRAAPAMCGATLLQLGRPGVLLALFATIAGIIARFCASLIPGAEGIVAGGTAGAGVFLSLVWVTDEPLSIGVRACLSIFFPALESNRASSAPKIP
jgi:lipopolysaccharide exporter